MTHIIVYPDNSLCINGKMQYYDPRRLAELSIPERRPGHGTNQCDHPIRKRVGDVNVTAFRQPAHSLAISTSEKKHEADRRRNEQTRKQHAAMVADYNKERAGREKHDMACMRVAAKWSCSAKWVNKVVMKAMQGERS